MIRWGPAKRIVEGGKCKSRGCPNPPREPLLSCRGLCGTFRGEKKESRHPRPKPPFSFRPFQAVAGRVWPLAPISSWLKDRNLLSLFGDTAEVGPLVYSGSPTFRAKPLNFPQREALIPGTWLWGHRCASPLQAEDVGADPDAQLEETLLRDVSGVLHIIRLRLWKIVRDRRKHQQLLQESH